MQRRILLLLSLVLLAGCQSVPQAAMEEKAGPVIQKPPALTVRVGENEGTAALSTYSWDWPNSDGTRSGVEADGLHPLDMLEYVTPIFLNDEGTVELRFDLGTLGLDHLTLRRWDLSCAGDPTKYESDFDMLSCTVQGDTVTAVLPEDPGGIFEVHAYFTGESHGDGYYTFCLQDIQKKASGFSWEKVRIRWREEQSELPMVRVVRTRAELQEALSTETAQGGALPDREEAFFADRELLVLLFQSGSGSISLEVTRVLQSSSGVTVVVRRTVPEVCTADMAAWLLLVELPAGTVQDRPVTVMIQENGAL